MSARGGIDGRAAAGRRRSIRQAGAKSAVCKGIAWCLALVAAGACGSDPAPDDEGPPQVRNGALALRIIASPPALELWRGDTRITQAGGDGSDPRRGIAYRQGTSDIEMKFGSFRVEDTTTAPWQAVASLRAITPTSASGTTPAGATFVAVGGDGKDLGTGTVAALPGGGFAIDLTLPGNRVSVALPCAAAEHFLGLGGQSWDVDHRGQTVPLWVAEDGLGKKDSDEPSSDWSLIGRRHSTHTPIPFYLSSAAYGALLETAAYARFALCSEDADVARLEAWDGTLRLRLFAGATPLQTLEQSSAHMGRPQLPPLWAFAPWIDAMYGSDNVLRVAAKLRERGVAAAALWSEDWRGGVKHGEGYTLEEHWHLDAKLYPDAKGLVAALAAKGFRWMTYNNTFLSASADVYGEAIAKGYSIQRAKDGGGTAPYLFDGVKFEKSSLLDLHNPAAVTWAKDVMRKGLELGVAGWMADFAEWLPTDIVLPDGSDPLLAHNLYPVAWQRFNRELFDAHAKASGDAETLFFVRAAWLGSQSLVSVVWAGDQQTDFSLGDGFPSVIPMGIGLGIAGFPYYGHDIGGYMSAFTEPTTKELWFRWVTLGALSPVMRTHHGRAAFANWSWESDDASTAHLARWAKLHLRLLPYLHRLARDAADTGAPMVRPLALDWPMFAPGWTATDLWALGRRLIVVPVVAAGATSRTVTLPAGTYFDLLTGASWISDGASPLTLQLPWTEIGALVPAGSLLVLLPEAIETTVASPQAVDLTDVAGQRELWLFRGGEDAWAEPGGASYSWNAGTLQAMPAQATWNGAAVGAGQGAISVTGNGTLQMEGGAVLSIQGAGAEAVTVVRVR